MTDETKGRFVALVLGAILGARVLAPPYALGAPAGGDAEPAPRSTAPSSTPSSTSTSTSPSMWAPGAASPPAADPAGAALAPTATPSAAEAWRDGPRQRVAVMPRFSYRLGSPGLAVTPSEGFGIAGTFETTYLRLAEGLEAALGVDFSHDRFSRSEQGSVSVDNMTETFRSPRVTSETSFVLIHTASVQVSRLRAYLTLGAGLGLGYFDSAAQELRPGTARDTHALGRVSLGFDVRVSVDWQACLRADYTALRGVSSFVTEAGERLALFGDLFGLGVGLAYRF